MTRILTYNILYGGTGRVNELTKMIGSARPDIVGLVEASDPQVVEELAHSFDKSGTYSMQHYMTAPGKHKRDHQLAVLSRLPVIRVEAHVRPGILTRPLLEVCVEESGGEQLTVFVTHLTAAFNQLRAGDFFRRREVQEIMNIMAPKRGTSHLLIGDFNALAPGDSLQASALLRYLLDIDRRYPHTSSTLTGLPNLESVIPWYLRVFNPLLRAIPRNKLLSALFDATVSLYAPRESIGLLRNAGYVDCFRCMNPRARGFTCPTESPAGRIDFIFASPHLARRLAMCCVVTEGEGVPGDQASDHFPLCAEFCEP